MQTCIQSSRLPAVYNLWCGSLESQGIREGHIRVQEALLFWLVLVNQKTVHVALPLTDVLAIVSVALVSGVVVTNRGLDTLQKR